MTEGLNKTMLALILFCVLTEAGREICFKFASAKDRGNIYLHPWTLTGIVFWGVELVAWTYVLAHVPLSIACSGKPSVCGIPSVLRWYRAASSAWEYQDYDAFFR